MATAELTDEQIDAIRRKNFDELMDWLHENGARLLREQAFGDRGDRIAMYEFAGRALIVQTYARGQGWEFYAPLQCKSTWPDIKAALGELRP